MFCDFSPYPAMVYTMAIDTLHTRILGYFESEIEALRNHLETGQFKSFKDQVIAGLKIAEALDLLAPYARRNHRARRLVRKGKTLINDLLSVREVIRRGNSSPHLRQLLLISKVMSSERYLQ